MKTYNLKNLDEQNNRRRDIAIKADPDFYRGKRKFDIPRKTEGMQEILDRLEREENELLH